MLVINQPLLLPTPSRSADDVETQRDTLLGLACQLLMDAGRQQRVFGSLLGHGAVFRGGRCCAGIR